jgi:hypothetical protein
LTRESGEKVSRMADKDIPDNLGLGYKSLMSTQGKLCAEKFAEVLETIQKDEVSNEVKGVICSQFKSWCAMTAQSLREETLRKYKNTIYDMIYAIASSPDDDAPEGKSYKGKQAYLSDFVDAIGTAKSLDTTQKLAAELVPLSYNCVIKLLDSGVSFEEKCKKIIFFKLIF